MRIANLYWVFVLALIIALVSRQEIVWAGFQVTNKQVGQSLAETTVPSTLDTELLIAVNTADLNEGSRTRVADSPGDAALAVEATADNKNDALSDPSAVVGRAFPVPASIEADCKKRQDDICNDIMRNLAKMRQEPRDLMWARDTEALIRHDVLQEEQPGRFRIRHIECRTSICAAEVESTFTANGIYGSYMGGIQAGHDAIKAVLRTYLSTFAYEIDSSGARITVTLITFTRREAPK